jgi:hypothetical protein
MLKKLFITVFILRMFDSLFRTRLGIFGIPHNFANWLALLLQVDSLERPSFT